VNAQQPNELEALPAPRSRRILVVDSNEVVMETVAGLLTESGHVVTTSKSLPEARRLVATQEFDLVVADRQMVFPGELRASSPETAKNEPGLGSRVLWMSSVSAEEHGPARFLPADAAVLQKPFQAGELYAAVEAMLLPAVAPLLQG
jgi:CheY-like chemotaxis protein